MAQMRRDWRYIGPMVVFAVGSTVAARAAATTSDGVVVFDAVSTSATGTVGDRVTAGDALPAVSLEPVDVSSRAGHGDIGRDTVAQTISLVVVAGGGPLSTTPGSADVVLRRVGGSSQFRGYLDDVTVVDPRGSLVGWTLSARYVDGPAGVLFLRPSAVVGTTLTEATTARPSRVPRGGSSALATAASGGGGGTYRVDAELRFTPSSAIAGDSVTLSIALAAR
jgi:hypothetical protein